MRSRTNSESEQMSTLFRLFFESMEAATYGLTTWIKSAVDTHAVQLLATSAVEFQTLEAWCDVPDVNKGNVGELTTPVTSDADTAAKGHEHVAEVLAAVETFVGVTPDTVHGVSPFGLCQDIFEGDSQMVVDVVWITVDKINFTHV